MLTGLHICNFKSLRDTGKLDIKPITFLVGPNSSGKTSVLQAILALRQTIRNKEIKSAFILQDYIDLGSFKDIVWGHNLKNNIIIKLSDSTDNVEIEFAYQKNNESIFLKRFRNFGVSYNGTNFFNFDYEVVRNQKGNYSLKIYNFENFVEKEYKIDFSKFYQIRNVVFDENKDVPKIFKKISEDKNYKPDKIEDNILKKSLFEKLSNITLVTFFESKERHMVRMFDQIFHIGPLRRESQRVYTGSGAFPLEVGKSGEWVVDELISNPETIKNVYLFSSDTIPV